MAISGKPVPAAPEAVVGDARLDRMRAAARLLDSQFRIPGTRIRFGLDAVAGLVPGVGFTLRSKADVTLRNCSSSSPLSVRERRAGNT